VAIQRDPKERPILLGRPVLKDLAIIIDNSTNDWEFKKARVEVLKASTSRKSQGNLLE